MCFIFLVDEHFNVFMSLLKYLYSLLSLFIVISFLDFPPLDWSLQALMATVLYKLFKLNSLCLFILYIWRNSSSRLCYLTWYVHHKECVLVELSNEPRFASNPYIGGKVWLYNCIMSLYLLSTAISLDEEYTIMHSWSLMNDIGVGGQN